MKALYTGLVIGLLLTGIAVHRMYVASLPVHHSAVWVDPNYCPPDPRECD